MMAGLYLDASAYSSKNQAAISGLRAILQDIHTGLAFGNTGLEIFIRRHIEETMSHLKYTFEGLMTQVFDTI